MLKVITPQEVKRLEKSASGKKQEKTFMLAAGKVIFDSIKTHFPKKKKIYLLIGKGNNGGDAYVAGLEMLKRKYKITAYLLFSEKECSSLNNFFSQQFKKKGGKVKIVRQIDDLSFDADGLIVDGIFGIGFSSTLPSIVEEVIKKVNNAHLPIVSIDIPSGVNAETGEVLSSAICADMTIALGFYKTGFFLKQGFNHVGKILVKNFGLTPSIMEGAKEKYLLLERDEIKKTLLPKIIRNRNKYEAGYVIGFAGSYNMDGAAKLASLASLRSGAGIVKIFLPEELEYSSQNFPYEVVKLFWSKDRLDEILAILEKANALFIGPGMGRENEVLEFLSKLCPKVKKPCVIDGDALYFYANSRISYPENSIITPHSGEMKRLLQQEEFSHEDCQQYVNKKEIILVLKGAPSFIFAKGKKPLIMPYGDAGMATAGSGDVLTGILAALLAQGLSSYDAAILGVHLHAFAGEIAAKIKTSYSMIASDIIDYLPEVLKNL